jgi:hypothetical protein
MFGQFNPQNDEITKKFFPDSELDIHTPSFSKKGFTNYDDMMLYLNKLVADHPKEITLSFIGESQKNKKIPMVVLNKDNGKEKVKVVYHDGSEYVTTTSDLKKFVFQGQLFLVNRKY